MFKRLITGFETRQDLLEEAIYNVPSANNLPNDAIADGVGDAKAYLSSFPKVAWVLKEPYDIVSDGKAAGGGWSISKDCFMKDSGSWSVRTWQRVIYVVYGLRHHLSYSEMDYISNDWDMGKVLREIAWINLSKMPALTTSSDKTIRDAYEKYWKVIVKEQLDLYKPDVIIFGNTLNICRNFILGNEDKAIEHVFREGQCFVEVFKKAGRLLLNAYHPGFISIPGVKGAEEHYVDSLIATIEKYYGQN